MSGDVLSPLVPASSILENTEIPTIIADDDGGLNKGRREEGEEWCHPGTGNRNHEYLACADLLSLVS